MSKWSEGLDGDRRAGPGKGAVFRNIPPPPGSREGNPYTRFIPREELGEFAAWSPVTLRASDAKPGRATPANAPAEPPPPPTASEWAKQVDAARKQGTSEGYQNGYRDGLVALENFKQNLALQNAAQVNQLLQSMDDAVSALQPQLAQSVASVALGLAEQVLRTELAQRPDVVAHVATQALQAVLLSARHINVYVSPQDLALVADGAADALQTRGAKVHVRASLARGDCVIESDLGSIDARVATRWAQATASLSAAAALGEPAPQLGAGEQGTDLPATPEAQ